MSAIKLPSGIHSALASMPPYPLADLDLLRRRWKVFTSRTAKARETELAKLLRFIIDLHAAIIGHPRPADYADAPGKIIWESVLEAIEMGNQPNPKLPISWLDALQPVWQSWLEADTAKKRFRQTAEWKRTRDEETGKFKKTPKNKGEFPIGNRHRFAKNPLPEK